MKLFFALCSFVALTGAAYVLGVAVKDTLYGVAIFGGMLWLLASAVAIAVFLGR